MSNVDYPWCCHIDESGHGCVLPAEWLIEAEDSSREDYTHACTQHVGELLGTNGDEPKTAFRVTAME